MKSRYMDKEGDGRSLSWMTAVGCGDGNVYTKFTKLSLHEISPICENNIIPTVSSKISAKTPLLTPIYFPLSIVHCVIWWTGARA